MTTLSSGITGADFRRSGRPDFALVSKPDSLDEQIQTYTSWLLKQPGVTPQIYTSSRIAIRITNPDRFFNLELMARDCRLRDNNQFCPGSQEGVITFTLIEEGDLHLDSNYPNTLRALMYDHRRLDLDPPASAA